MNAFQYFEESNKRYPENTALVVRKQAYTYAELSEVVERIAAPLAEQEEHFIGFFAYRSQTSFATVLAAMKAGKAYVPLSPKFPNSRNHSISSIAGLKTIVVGEECLGTFSEFITNTTEKFLLIFPDNTTEEIGELQLDGHQVLLKNDLTSKLRQSVSVTETQYAYMLFTSGSTGLPKGVPISHKNLCAYVDYSLKRYQFSSEDRFTNTFEQTFDLSIHDMFLAWANGASLYCIPESDLLAPGKFIRANEITCWFSVPSVAGFMNKLRMLKPDTYPSLRYSLFCGEPLPEEITRKWQLAASNSVVENLYGPTEATIAITNYRWDKDDQHNKSHNGLLSIGKRYDTQQVKIVDDEGNEVKQGETGELLLGGSQVTDQYWKNLKKTAEHFLRFEDSNENWYRTGDLVFEDAEGDMFFVSRKDFQVKIQGHRIELLEIDHILMKALPNSEIVSVAYPHNDIAAKIYTFVSGKSTKSEKELMDHCAQSLPNYMVPSRFHFIERMPLNSNGKIDRNALYVLLDNKK